MLVYISLTSLLFKGDGLGFVTGLLCVFHLYFCLTILDPCITSTTHLDNCMNMGPCCLRNCCRTSGVTSLFHECHPADSAPSLRTPSSVPIVHGLASLSYSHLSQTFELPSKQTDFCFSSVLIFREFGPAVPLKHWTKSCLTLLE